MFFLLRAAFWLSLAVLLLPSGEDGQPQTAQVSTGEAIYAAQTFVADISGFCERNPDTCQTGEQALKTFGSKARYGAKLVYGYLGDFTGEDADIPHRTVATTRVQVQPAEGIHLQMQSKVPDANMQLRLMELGFRFSQQYEKLPDAYQRLLMDAISGDPSLFARSDEVELAWGVIDPIIHAWEDGYEMPLGHYDIGYWGPDSCRTWMEQQGRQWFDVCPVLH